MMDKIHAIAIDELEKMRDSGYFHTEIEPNELAEEISDVALRIAARAIESLEPKQYVRIDGRFYNKAAILSTIKPKGRL